jgi:hypothetical protein
MLPCLFFVITPLHPLSFQGTRERFHSRSLREKKEDVVQRIGEPL